MSPCNHDLLAVDMPDLRQVLSLVLTVTSPLARAPLVQRSQQLLGGLSAFIDADVWLWRCVDHGQRDRPLPATCELHGGWQHDAELMFGLALAWRLADSTAAVSSRTRQAGLTRLPPLVAPCPWDPCPWDSAGAIADAGFSDAICHKQRLTEGRIGLFGAFRRAPRSEFAASRRNAAIAVLAEVPWLDDCDQRLHDHEALTQLTPRERQVTSLLLQGNSRKQVATLLSLSEHTVADYLKVIYRKLGVTTRAELLARLLGRGAQDRHPA